MEEYKEGDYIISGDYIICPEEDNYVIINIENIKTFDTYKRKYDTDFLSRFDFDSFNTLFDIFKNSLDRENGFDIVIKKVKNALKINIINNKTNLNINTLIPREKINSETMKLKKIKIRNRFIIQKKIFEIKLEKLDNTDLNYLKFTNCINTLSNLIIKIQNDIILI